LWLTKNVSPETGARGGGDLTGVRTDLRDKAVMRRQGQRVKQTFCFHTGSGLDPPGTGGTFLIS